jgi:hypothetical protein
VSSPSASRSALDSLFTGERNKITGLDILVERQVD